MLYFKLRSNAIFSNFATENKTRDDNSISKEKRKHSGISAIYVADRGPDTRFRA